MKQKKVSTNPFKRKEEEYNVKDINDILSRRGLSPSDYSLTHRSILYRFIKNGLNIDKIKNPNISKEEFEKERKSTFKKKEIKR